MWPTLFEVETTNGPVGMHAYGLFVLMAFTSSLALVHVRARRLRIPVERLPLAYMLAGFGGFIGAKVLYALGTMDPGSLVSFTGGFAWYGGLIGGAIAVRIAAVPLKVPAWTLADATVPAIVLGGGIGRLGCLFAGCCHGGPVPHEATGALLPPGTLKGQIWLHEQFPFISTSFEGGAARLLDTPLYPTQIWQSLGSFALAGFLLWYSRRRRFDGELAALFLVTEPLLRFVVESFRADHRGFALSVPEASVPSWLPLASSAGEGMDAAMVGITTSQAIGLMMVALGVAIFFWRRHAELTEPLADDEAEWTDDLVDDLS